MKKNSKKNKKNKKKQQNPPKKAPQNQKDGEDDETYHSQSDEDYSDTQEERKNEYRKGGYHPVTEGELYNSRYRIVKKLGWGYFSTVWLVYDHDEKNFKAIKIQKSAPHYREAAYDEITLLTQISQGDTNNEKCCCILTDQFEHKGPNGRHVVMVFEVLGENLLQLIMKYNYKGIPLPIVKSIAKQILIGLDYLHRELSIIHTDLKPENIVVSTPWPSIQKIINSYIPPSDRFKQLSLIEKDPSTLTKSQKKRLKKKLKQKIEGESTAEGTNEEKAQNGDGDGDEEDKAVEEEEPLEEYLKRYSKVKLVDFGNACWTHKHFTDEIQTRQYRSPEVILRNSYDTSADIWSCACLIFELLTGDFLFDPQESEFVDRDEDHLALMIELLQTQPQVPPCLYAKGSNEYVTSQGYLRHINHLKFWDLQSVLHEKYKMKWSKAGEIADFLLPMLAIDPSQRATAQQMLNHPFLEPREDDLEPYQQDEDAEADPTQEWTHGQGESDEEVEEVDRICQSMRELHLPPDCDPEILRNYLQHQHNESQGRARSASLSPAARGEEGSNESQSEGSRGDEEDEREG